MPPLNPSPIEKNISDLAVGKPNTKSGLWMQCKHLMRTLLIVSCLALMCSCASYRVQDIRESEQENWLVELSRGTIDGRYANEAQNERSRTLLWSLLTEKESQPKDSVRVKMLDDKQLRFALMREGQVISERTFSYSLRRDAHLRLPDQQRFRGLIPLVWGWGTTQIALGITREQRLSVYTVGSGSLMIGPLPLFGGGGGRGLVDEFERLAE